MISPRLCERSEATQRPWFGLLHLRLAKRVVVYSDRGLFILRVESLRHPWRMSDFKTKLT